MLPQVNALRALPRVDGSRVSLLSCTHEIARVACTFL